MLATSALTRLASRSSSSRTRSSGRSCAWYGPGLDALRAQPRGDPLAVGDGEAVDDAVAGQLRELLGEPGHALGAVAQLDRLEPEAGPGERPADDLHADAELLDDVGDHAVVRGGGGREDRDPLGQRRDEPADAPVVRPEVVAPVADAVRLVDHEQPDRRAAAWAARSAPKRSFDSRSGEIDQDVDLVVGDRASAAVPLLDVAGVDGHRPEAQAVGGAELVAHERKQRADDERRPLPAIAQHPRRQPVHEALAPPGPLDDERPTARRATASTASRCPSRNVAPGPSSRTRSSSRSASGAVGSRVTRSAVDRAWAPRWSPLASLHATRRGMPSMPQYRPARPPAMHAVVSVSCP